MRNSTQQKNAYKWPKFKVNPYLSLSVYFITNTGIWEGGKLVLFGFIAFTTGRFSANPDLPQVRMR